MYIGLLIGDLSRPPVLDRARQAWQHGSKHGRKAGRKSSC